MVTIKDYAKGCGISYEAARQQISRYIDREVDGFRLAEHVTKVGRTKYLDDEAVEFLDGRRAKNPVIIQQEERDETIERLRQRVDELQSRLIASQEEYRVLLQDKHAIELREQALIADRQKIDELRTAKENAERRAEDAAERERAAVDAKDAAEAETVATKKDLDRIAADSAKEAQEARTEIERLRTEAERLRTWAEEARDRADRMEAAGLFARIFRSW